MILGLLMGALTGGVLAVPLLRWGARPDRVRLSRALTGLAFIAVVVVAIVGVPLVLTSYPRAYANILVGFPAAVTLLLIPFVAREKPRDWSQLPHACGGLLGIVILGSELFLGLASAGLFPARFPAALDYVAGPRAVSALAGALKDGDPAVRREAVRRLAMYRPTAMAPLQRAAADRDEGARSAALSALAYTPDPDSTPLMLTALQDPSPKIRGISYLYFEKQYDPRIAGPLLAILASNPPTDELRGIQRLVAGAMPQIAPVFAEQLRSTDPAIRRSAVQALGRAVHAETVPLLEVALRDREPTVRVLAAEFMGKITEDPQLERKQLFEAIQNGGKVRQIRAIGDRPPDVARVVRNLTRALRDPHLDVRIAAAKALKEAREETVTINGSRVTGESETGRFAPNTNAAIGPLLACMKEGSADLRLAAAGALVNCAVPASVPTLAAALAAVGDEDRRSIIEALGNAGDRRALPLVRKYGVDLHESPTCEVCQALYNLGSYDDILHHVYEDRE